MAANVLLDSIEYGLLAGSWRQFEKGIHGEEKYLVAVSLAFGRARPCIASTAKIVLQLDGGPDHLRTFVN